MNNTTVIQEIGSAAIANPVCARLLEVSLEVAILAGAIWILIRTFRVRSARLCSLLWILVLAKGLLGLAVGAPFALADFHLAAPEEAGRIPADRIEAPVLSEEERARGHLAVSRALQEADEISLAGAIAPKGGALPAAKRTRAPARSRLWNASAPASFAVPVLLAAWLAGILWVLFRTVRDLLQIRRLCLASGGRHGLGQV